jgi:4-amino-4-deoxy-L-arabinose transferase-like glycosyltransferase
VSLVLFLRSRSNYFFAVGLPLYFLLHLISRVWVSPSLELDEAEQVLLAQSLSLGEGLQPPLYTWLQWIVFQLTGGPSVFGLALFKAVLLWLSYWCVYKAASLVLAKNQAVAAALGLALFPQILWESQRDLTHTVLLVACVAALWWLAIHLLAQLCSSANTKSSRKTLRLNSLALIAGCLLAAGMLSKYSFVIVGFTMGLALAWTLVSERLLSARDLFRFIALAVFVAAALFAPHGLWLLENMGSVQASVAGKLGAQGSGAWLESLLQSFQSLAQAALGFVALWLVVGLGVYFYSRLLKGLNTPASKMEVGPQQEPHDFAKTQATVMLFLKRYFTLLGFAFLLLILLADASQFKDRWMQPFLFLLPLASLLALRNAPALSFRLSTSYHWFAVLLMALTLVLMPLRTVLSPSLGGFSRLNIPHDQLAKTLKNDFPDQQLWVAEHRLLAGNLALYSKAYNWRVYETQQARALANDLPWSQMIYLEKVHLKDPLKEPLEAPSKAPLVSQPYDARLYRFPQAVEFRVYPAQTPCAGFESCFPFLKYGQTP